MTVLPILQYPNARLRQLCMPVAQAMLQTDELKGLCENLTETLYAHTGAVGLAAPQVGQALRMIVVDATAKTTRERYFLMINPVIETASQWKYGREGCLSFPDYLVTVKRARKITVSWLNATGNLETETFRDFEAIIIQHEIDHLDGILFLDRIQNLQTDLMLRQPTTGGSVR